MVDISISDHILTRLQLVKIRCLLVKYLAMSHSNSCYKYYIYRKSRISTPLIVFHSLANYLCFSHLSSVVYFVYSPLANWNSCYVTDLSVRVTASVASQSRVTLRRTTTPRLYLGMVR